MNYLRYQKTACFQSNIVFLVHWRAFFYLLFVVWFCFPLHNDLFRLGLQVWVLWCSMFRSVARAVMSEAEYAPNGCETPLPSSVQGIALQKGCFCVYACKFDNP